MRRRSGGRSGSGPGAGHRLFLGRPLHLHHLRARRHDARAGLHLSLPLAAHPGRDAGRALAAGHLPPRPRRAARSAQEGRELGRRAATASTATSASWSARPASTSATAASSSASTAASASTPATRSWTASAGPRDLIAYDTDCADRRPRWLGSKPVYKFVRAARSTTATALVRGLRPDALGPGDAQPGGLRGAARPQSDLRAAARRRDPQRLHTEDRQPQLRAARVHGRASPACRTPS